MSLDIYKYNSETNEFVKLSEGTFLNPALSSHNGTDGQTIIEKLYLRNDDDALYYKDISVQHTPDEFAGPNNTNKFVFKLLSGDIEPTEAEWGAIVSGNVLTSVLNPTIPETGNPRNWHFPEIGKEDEADNAFYPFFRRVEVPKGTPVQVFTKVKLSVEADENSI